MPAPRFPDDFLWGVATSAQQIEGATAMDGRAESIWDRFAATPGMIEDGSNPSVACDHYHRWQQDVELMKELGLGAYRFSISWPRVLPQGRGEIKTAGLDFYDKLVDELLDSGIAPFVTLYHWDLPQVLQDGGGWVSRDTADSFVEYTSAVVARLGDRVRHWITHNEPWCAATLGYEEGHHAPGHKNPGEALRAAHHLLLSHGWAAGVIREQAPSAEVGITLILTPVQPASSSEADRDAARRFDGFFNRWYLDPICRGVYPAGAVADRVRRGHLESQDLPFVEPGDMGVISVPLDFLGINYYSRIVVRADEMGEPIPVPMVPEEERTDMGWEVYPQGLLDSLVRVHREYSAPAIYITENGAAYTDQITRDGRVEDHRRVEYLRGHLRAAHDAIADGVPLRGYFVWSLLDNFEWGLGYAKRFGLYHVDFDTQQRIPRDSAFWYRDAIAANTVPDASV